MAAGELRKHRPGAANLQRVGLVGDTQQRCDLTRPFNANAGTALRGIPGNGRVRPAETQHR
ncbi:hypothetical protein EN812_33185 [Mesorhizobium sp. M4B.F.Ca.ET.169.01.1.1]|nr:hypothetical protein EN812_33185 [Mesorhizobium sp. M4B.F.Ca.ET.169.01.1.1]